MTQTTCNVCGSGRVRQISVQGNLVYFCCSQCFYCEKRPELGSAHDDFIASQATYYEDPLADPFSEPMPIQREKMNQRTLLAGRYLQPGARILEIGPGNGTFLNWAQSSGYRCTACEQSSVLSSALRARGFEVIEGEFEQLVLEDRYDVLFSFHIIEHIASPLSHLTQALSLTRPGGHLVVATPNAASWQQRLFPSLSANFDTAHLHVLSLQSLSALGKMAGWDVIDHVTPENASGWLRFVSKLVRRMRGEDETVTAGKYANMSADGGRMTTFIRLFAAVSYPFRLLQSKVGGGNEIVVVFRKPEIGTRA